MMTRKTVGVLATTTLLFGLAAMTGCDGGPETNDDTPSWDGNEARGRLGKADLPGSCAPADCGGKSDGLCWCDEICVQYGDCCADVKAVCTLGGNDCIDNDDCAEGFCGWADDDSTRICKPWGEVGDSCEGFVLPSHRVFCDPSLECVPSEPTFDAPGVCQPAGQTCDPTLICTQVITCVGGLQYPTGCGPANCDEPMGPCLPDPPPPPPAPTCEGFCGGPAMDKLCYCDAVCESFGDCCDDYEPICL